MLFKFRKWCVEQAMAASKTTAEATSWSILTTQYHDVMLIFTTQCHEPILSFFSKQLDCYEMCHFRLATRSLMGSLQDGEHRDAPIDQFLVKEHEQ